MNNTLARSIFLALSLVTAVAPATRVAHACGGYGANFDPGLASVRTLAEHLQRTITQRNRAAALDMFAADARIDPPQHSGSCCHTPAITAAQWVEQALGDRTFTLGNILGVSRAQEDGSFVVHYVQGTSNGAAINTLITMRYIEQRARITHVSQRYTGR